MGKKRILVIDDESKFTNLLRLNLEKTGKYEVREVNQGRKGAAAAREFKPDLIILDVIMPDLAGGEVAEKIKADPNLRNVPIIFLTASVAKKEIGEDGGMRGGLFFVPKPITMAKLEACIEKFLPPSPPEPQAADSDASKGEAAPPQSDKQA